MAMGFLGQEVGRRICLEEELEETLWPVFPLFAISLSKILSESTVLDLNPVTFALKVRNYMCFILQGK